MDIRKIKKLIEMLQDSDLTEIEVKEGEESVRIARGKTLSNESHSQPTIAPVISLPPDKASISPEETGTSIKSPIVGTFYRKPAALKRLPTVIKAKSFCNGRWALKS